MSGLFEFMAANDDSSRVAGRKALALARARATKRFAKFLSMDEDRQTRLALVAGDLSETVKQACADAEYDDWEGVLASVQEYLGGVAVESARRPKMCPVHREITDISLQQGDPQAGFSAMAQHMFSDNSCRGTWEGGKCNFKPEMATQTYWDQKAEKAEQRRQERQQQQEAQPLAEGDLIIDEPVAEAPVVDEAINTNDSQEFDFDLAEEDFGGLFEESPQMAVAAKIAEAPRYSPANPQVTDAAGTRPAQHNICSACNGIGTDANYQPCQACGGTGRSGYGHAARTAALVPNPIIHGGSMAPLSLIAQKKPGLLVNGQPFENFAAEVNQRMATEGMPQYESIEVSHPHPDWERVAAGIAQQGHDGPLREHMQARRQQRQQPMQQNQVDYLKGVVQAKTAEALETVDVTKGGETPLPKMDKREWTPENVTFVDSEMSGSPHPTHHQDIVEPVDHSKDPLEQTRTVTEAQDVTKSSNPTDGGGEGGSWTRDNGTSPVTSAQDPDRNPIRDAALAEFPSEEDVAAAIEAYQGR